MTRRVLVVVGSACAATVAAVVLYRFDPATSAVFPPCPFYAMTSWYCPGCGSLRAFHAVLHGEWLAAFGFNPLTTLLLPLLLVGAVAEVRRVSGVARPYRTPAPAWTIWTLLFVLVAFALLRNLRWFGFLAPG